MDALAARSREMLAPLMALDHRVADALATHSLPALSEAFADLRARAEASEAHLEGGGEACGCDVALNSLLLVVGFAINKLDGEGRYQDWMRAQSLELLEDYRGLAADCALDSGRATFASSIQAQHIETL